MTPLAITVLLEQMWHLLFGAITVIIAVLRWGGKRSGKPSLRSRLWTWWLLVSNREIDNQRLSRRLLAQDALIRSLQADLDLASGIASSHESGNGEAHHWPSGEPTTHSHSHSTGTTDPGSPPGEHRSVETSSGDRRSGLERRKQWCRK